MSARSAHFPKPNIRTDSFALGGGLDLVTSAPLTPPGTLLAMLNYECGEGGYGRIRGMERFDGQPRPYQASYSVLNFDAGTAIIGEGDVVTGATSGASGKAITEGVAFTSGGTYEIAIGDTITGATSTATAVIVKITVTSGSWAGDDAAGNILVDTVSGAFQAENLDVGLNLNVATIASDFSSAVVTSGTYAGADAAGYLILTNVTGTFQNNEALQVNEVAFTSGGATEIAAGDTITGSVSGETAQVVSVTVTSGTWAAGTAAGTISAVNISGAFQAENLLVSAVDLATIAGDFAAVTKSVADGVAAERGASSDTDDDNWYRDAIETARALIAAVPGAGQIRGVWYFNGAAYAFRDDAATPTECRMYKSTAAGWVQVTFGEQVAFTSGSVEPIEGETITGATSTETSIVRRVNLTGGTWAGGNAVGWLTIDTPSGNFQAEDLNGSTAGANFATIAGDSAAITLAPSGRFEFRTHNFYGASNLRRMYGVDGVNTAFEFDGTYLTPIHTGMVTDTPNHLAVYKNRLHLAFPGGSLQFSGAGTPNGWTAVLGAAEIGMGDDITGFLESIQSMTVFSRNQVALFTGSSSSDFALDVISDDSGAVEWTAQQIIEQTYVDDAGVRTLSATQAFGDFKQNTLTRKISPLLRTKRNGGVTPVASVRSRNGTTYRLFYSDGSGVSIYLGAKEPQIGAFNIGKTVRCICQSEETDGSEIILFGSDDGYIYQLDVGNSLDGTEMDFFVRLAFHHAGAPDVNKTWKTITLHVDAQETIALSILADFDYGGGTPAASQDFTVQGGGGFWDEAFWNEFEWDSAFKSTAQAYINGHGPNISAAIAGATTYDDPHTLQTVTYRYSLKGLTR